MYGIFRPERAEDTSIWHVFSTFIPFWAIASRILPDLPSPFPVAVAATAFAIPYHILVIGDDLWYTAFSGIVHIAAIVLSPVDISWTTMLLNFAIFLVFAIAVDFMLVYAVYLPQKSSSDIFRMYIKGSCPGMGKNEGVQSTHTIGYSPPPRDATGDLTPS